MSQIQDLSNPIWNKTESSFVQKLGYPFPRILKSPEECVKAVDWIVQNVISLYDDDDSICSSQWYDFIWTIFWSTRTRIVQLQLDDLEGVGIIERCARFHIFSAHEFAEMTEPSFVSKFNFEHIGKCLITLKYLYHDLNGRGINCTNEAEFLSYYLIHFPKSYRDLLDFPPIIRLSKPIQFALKFIETLNTSNFIAFFKLVEEATFLQACLLHRYFFQMRIRAFSVMCKAYNRAPDTVLSINVAQIVSLLAFEDVSELESYLIYGGIEFDFDNVYFKSTYCPGAGPTPAIRESGIAVGYKRENQSLIDVITGGEGLMMPANKNPILSEVNLNDYKDGKFGENLSYRVRLAEAIWKSIFFQVVNDRVLEICTKLRYPNGEPEYEYDDQPTLGSLVSELDGSRNESNAELIFEENVEKEASQIKENTQSKVEENDQVKSVVLPEPELGPYIEPEPEPEPKSKSEIAPEVEPDPINTISQEKTPDSKVPTSVQVTLQPRSRMRAIRARLINKARIPVQNTTTMRKSESEPEPELELESKCENQAEPVPESEQEAIQTPETLLEKSTTPISTSPDSETRSGPSKCLNTPEENYEQTSKTDENSTPTIKELDDSNLVISDDGDEEKVNELRQKKAVRVTIASILKAIEKYNNQHGKRL